MFKKTILLTAALWGSEALGAAQVNQTMSPHLSGALKSVQFALHPFDALTVAAENPENSLFLRYGREGASDLSIRLPFYAGYCFASAIEAGIGFLVAGDMFVSSLHQQDILKKVSSRFPKGHPAVIRQITSFLAFILHFATFYTNKIEPAHSGYYYKDEQVLSEKLPIALVPISFGYLATNAALSMKEGYALKNMGSLHRMPTYGAALLAALGFYFYADDTSDIANNFDMTEILIGGLWFWLLTTENQQITGLAPDAVRTVLATATVSGYAAYNGFDITDVTGIGIGGLLAFGLGTKNPKILCALAGLIATWSALGGIANTLVVGYSQTNTIN